MSIEFYLICNFILDALMITFIYLLRHVQEEFSINRELKCVSLIQFLMGFTLYFFLIVAPTSDLTSSNNLQYLLLIRGLLLLALTAWQPILASYNPNSIIPFPITEECIKTLDMALLMPTSANYFYEYLENSCENKDALIYFGMYADIRTY